MIILYFIFFSALSFGKEVPVSVLMDMAESYSHRIKAESFSIKAHESSLHQSRLIANPLFSFQGGSLKSGGQRGPIMDLSLSQPFPWPGKRKTRIEFQDFALTLSKFEKMEVDLQVRHRIYVLSAELAALQELESHYAERKRRFGLIEKSLRSRPLASPKQQVDRDLIESQINLLEKGMIDLVARKEALKWEIKIFSNLDFDRVLFSWDSLPEGLKKEEFIQLVVNSPRYKKLLIQSEMAQNKINEARFEARPDILLGVNYRQENVAPVNHFYHGMVSVVIPIIDHGQHSVEAARAEKRRTDAIRSFENDQILSLIHQAFSEYEGSKKALEVFRLKNLSSLENKFLEAEKSFRKGFIDALTFLQIDSQVHENIDQIYLSRVSYVNAVSELHLLIGKGPQ
jgi:hypothetical protein